MAISKELFEKLAKPVADIYNQIQLSLFLNMGNRLGKDRKLLIDDIERWSERRLMDLNSLTEDNIDVIKKLAPSATIAIEKATEQAGYAGVKGNETFLEKALLRGAPLLKPVPLSESEAILNILAAYRKQARDTLNLTNATLINQSEQVYRDIINKTVADTLVGNKTGQQALRQTVRDWSHKGIPALVDKAGREWGVEGYVRTVTRTLGNQVTNAMQEQRFDDYGVDLVEVSSHLSARPLCAPYQGKIYTRGNDRNYPNLYQDTSYGEPAGLFGINCHHVQYPYVPGMTQRYKGYDKERNDTAYENSQKQRYLERQIRYAKTEKAMLEKIGDTEGVNIAQEKISARQAKMREFIKETDRTRRYDREQVYS